ncbi:MAG: glycosyltransferase [Bacteroidota bacterium]|nr:glycosyltransferase [Bacteroidota bacterium]
MLSICIPIYNIVPLKLIKHLSEQISYENIEAEILLLDDASPDNIQDDLNKAKTIPEVSVHQASQNLGRSIARNRLAEIANYSYLLFMDCDSGIENKKYLHNYIKNAKPNTVCCGGTDYEIEKPQKSFMLRWKYGHQRESKSARTRNKNPYYAFTTHHFLIDKNTFKAIKFDTSIQGYGHEDSMFGLALKKHNIPILHIDNPLLHLGLEPASVFIKKTEHALKNLKMLYIKHQSESDFIASNQLLSFYKKQRKLRLIWFWKIVFSLSKPLIKIQLHSKNPSLKLFDFYKFVYFITKINH